MSQLLKAEYEILLNWSDATILKVSGFIELEIKLLNCVIMNELKSSDFTVVNCCLLRQEILKQSDNN